jgi:hypothetical protein
VVKNILGTLFGKVIFFTFNTSHKKNKKSKMRLRFNVEVDNSGKVFYYLYFHFKKMKAVVKKIKVCNKTGWSILMNTVRHSTISISVGNTYEIKHLNKNDKEITIITPLPDSESMFKYEYHFKKGYLQKAETYLRDEERQVNTFLQQNTEKIESFYSNGGKKHVKWYINDVAAYIWKTWDEKGEITRIREFRRHNETNFNKGRYHYKRSLFYFNGLTTKLNRWLKIF